MNSTYYTDNAIPRDLYNRVLREAQSLPWCRPPSGIPGNRTPRNVAVLGDGADIYSSSSQSGTQTPYLKNSRNMTNEVVYPMFQSCKDCSAHYKTRPITPAICELIQHFRQLVQINFGDSVDDVDKMFNIAICNFYTEKDHKINEHRDDERWLIRNQRNSRGELSASLIASLTLYPDYGYDEQPEYTRNFGIYNDDKCKWEDIKLKHNSVMFFSNHKHRCKGVPKKCPNIPRINITFRTITKGLLGYVGFSNFYRYMSIPYKLTFTESKYSKDRVDLFITEAKKANTFNSDNYYSENIYVDSANKANDKLIKSVSTEYNSLPRYVKPLCSTKVILNYNECVEGAVKIRINIKID